MLRDETAISKASLIIAQALTFIFISITWNFLSVVKARNSLGGSRRYHGFLVPLSGL